MSELNDEIRGRLFALQDTGYRAFQLKLIPTLDAQTVIGVRTPALKALAKELSRRGDADGFLGALPHAYFDENQLHAFILCENRDFSACMEQTELFLPFIDNWATCDQLSPKVFRKNKPELLSHIKGWLASDRTYTVRFAVGMLMEHFLDRDFDPLYLSMAAEAPSGEYYVDMMKAWYFATALAKQYEAAVVCMEDRRLDPWTHNKAIQKAAESRRISPERKEYLRSLRFA